MKAVPPWLRDAAIEAWRRGEVVQFSLVLTAVTFSVMSAVVFLVFITVRFPSPMLSVWGVAAVFLLLWLLTYRIADRIGHTGEAERRLKE